MIERIRNACVLVALSMVFSAGSAWGCVALIPSDNPPWGGPRGPIPLQDNVYLVRATVYAIGLSQEDCDRAQVLATCMSETEFETVDFESISEERKNWFIEHGDANTLTHFEVLETINGDPVQEMFSVLGWGRLPPEEDWLERRISWVAEHPDTYAQGDEGVHRGWGSQGWPLGDWARFDHCGMAPNVFFESGASYLIFEDQFRKGMGPSYASAERINTLDDDWLTFVRSEFARFQSYGVPND